MNRSPSLAVAFLFLLVVGQKSVPAQAPTRPEKPALVVLVSVDQLARWVYEQARPWFGDDGFLRLEREGVSFVRCAYRHACTFTGPGHATLGTGADAAQHGIVGNNWHDRTLAKSVYCCDDSETKLVGGKADGGGKSPRRLMAPTLGDTMKAHLGPEAKVFGVAWKDRSSILPAGRGADLALWIEDTTGLFQTSTWYAAALPPFVEALNATKPMDAHFGRSWDRIGPPEAYAGLVDERPFEAPAPGGNRSLPRTMNGGGKEPSVTYYAQLAGSPFASESVLDAARRGIEALDLGTGGAPDFVSISLSANDIIGHACGPRSVEVRDITLRTDRLVAELLGFLDRRVGAGRYVLILSADHGVAPVPETLKPLRLDAGRGQITQKAMQQANRALVDAFGAAPEGLGRWVAASDESSIYLHRDALAAAGIDLTRAAEVAAEGAARTEGIYDAIPTERVQRGALPDHRLSRALAAALYPGRVGDVMLVGTPHWLDTTIATSHGTPWPYDQEVPLVVMGPGLRAGFRSEAEVTPGLGVVIAARLLDLPRPALAMDEVPPGILTHP